MAAMRAKVDLTLDTSAAKRSAQKAVTELNKITGKMAGKDISFNVNGKSFTQPLGRITASANEFTKSLEASNARVIAFGASVGIINGITDSFKYLVTETIKFEKTLKDINVILNASNAQLKQFGEGLFDVAQNTAQAFNVAADAALEFSRQGLSTAEVLKRTNDALTLTRITSLDAAEAVSGLTAAVNAFGKTGLTTTDIIDKLAAVDVKFAVSSEDLINGLERAGAVAIDAGVSLDSLIGIITSLQQTTARGGAVIGNGLKTIFTRIQRPESIRQLEEMDLRVRDLTGAVLPADKILQNIAKSFKNLTQAQQSNVVQFSAGIFQANIFRAALGDLAKAQGIQQQALGISANAAGEAARKNELLNKSISALANQAGTGLQELVHIIGDLAIKDELTSALGIVGNVIESIKSSLGGGEGDGSTFAKGFVRGIGNVLTGPGMIAFAAIFTKLLFNVFKFAGSSLKDVLGVVSQKEKIKAVEQSIVQVLGTNKQVTESLNNLEGDRLAQEKYILGVIEAQTNAMTLQQRLARQLAGPLVSAGIDQSLSVPVSRSGIQDLNNDGTIMVGAKGVNPEAARREKKGAAEGGYAPGPIAQTKVPGVGNVVYNKAETIKQFPGMKQPAIMPPQKSRAGRNYGRAFGERHGFDPYASGGFVPNFFNQSHWGANDPRYKGSKIAQLSGTTLKLPPAKMMVETTKKDPDTGEKMVGWKRLKSDYADIKNMKTIKKALSEGGGGLDEAFSDLNITGLGRNVYHSSEDLPHPKYPKKYQASGRASALQRAARKGTGLQRRNASNIAGSAYEGTLFDKSLKGQEYNETWEGQFDKDGTFIQGAGVQDANIDFFKMDHIPLEAKFGEYKDPNIMGKSIKLSSDSYIEDFLRANGQGGAAEAMMAIKRGASIEVLKQLGHGEDKLEASGLSRGLVPNFAPDIGRHPKPILGEGPFPAGDSRIPSYLKALGAYTGARSSRYFTGATGPENYLKLKGAEKYFKTNKYFPMGKLVGGTSGTKAPALKMLFDHGLNSDAQSFWPGLQKYYATKTGSPPFDWKSVGWASAKDPVADRWHKATKHAMRHFGVDPVSGNTKTSFRGLHGKLMDYAKTKYKGELSDYYGHAPWEVPNATNPSAGKEFRIMARTAGFSPSLENTSLADMDDAIHANNVSTYKRHGKPPPPKVPAHTLFGPFQIDNKKSFSVKGRDIGSYPAGWSDLAGKKRASSSYLASHVFDGLNVPNSVLKKNLSSYANKQFNFDVNTWRATDLSGNLLNTTGSINNLVSSRPGAHSFSLNPVAWEDLSEEININHNKKWGARTHAHKHPVDFEDAGKGPADSKWGVTTLKEDWASKLLRYKIGRSGASAFQTSANLGSIDHLYAAAKGLIPNFALMDALFPPPLRSNLPRYKKTEDPEASSGTGVHIDPPRKKKPFVMPKNPYAPSGGTPVSLYRHGIGMSIPNKPGGVDHTVVDNAMRSFHGGEVPLKSFTSLDGLKDKYRDVAGDRASKVSSSYFEYLLNQSDLHDLSATGGSQNGIFTADPARLNHFKSMQDPRLQGKYQRYMYNSASGPYAGGLIPNFVRGIFDFDKMHKVPHAIKDKKTDEWKRTGKKNPDGSLKMTLPGGQRDFIINSIINGNIPYDVVHGVQGAGKSTWAKQNWPGAKEILSQKDFNAGDWTQFAVLAGQGPSRSEPRKSQPKGLARYSDQARALFAGARDIFAMMPSVDEVLTDKDGKAIKDKHGNVTITKEGDLGRRRRSRLKDAELKKLPDSRNKEELINAAVQGGRGDIAKPDKHLYNDLEDVYEKDIWRMKALGLVPNFSYAPSSDARVVYRKRPGGGSPIPVPADHLYRPSNRPKTKEEVDHIKSLGYRRTDHDGFHIAKPIGLKHTPRTQTSPYGLAGPISFDFLSKMIRHDREIYSIPAPEKGNPDLDTLGKNLISESQKDPVQVGYDSTVNRMQLLEGNHRVAAIARLNENRAKTQKFYSGIHGYVSGIKLDSPRDRNMKAGLVNQQTFPPEIPNSILEAMEDPHRAEGKFVEGVWSPSEFGIPPMFQGLVPNFSNDFFDKLNSTGSKVRASKGHVDNDLRLSYLTSRESGSQRQFGKTLKREIADGIIRQARMGDPFTHFDASNVVGPRIMKLLATAPSFVRGLRKAFPDVNIPPMGMKGTVFPRSLFYKVKSNKEMLMSEGLLRKRFDDSKRLKSFEPETYLEGEAKRLMKSMRALGIDPRQNTSLDLLTVPKLQNMSGGLIPNFAKGMGARHPGAGDPHPGKNDGTDKLLHEYRTGIKTRTQIHEALGILAKKHLNDPKQFQAETEYLSLAMDRIDNTQQKAGITKKMARHGSRLQDGAAGGLIPNFASKIERTRKEQRQRMRENQIGDAEIEAAQKIYDYLQTNISDLSPGFRLNEETLSFGGSPKDYELIINHSRTRKNRQNLKEVVGSEAMLKKILEGYLLPHNQGQLLARGKYESPKDPMMQGAMYAGLIPNFAGIDVYRGMLGEKGKKYTKSDVFGVHPKRKNQFRSSSIYDIGGLKDYLLGHVDNQQSSALVSTSTREGRAREFATTKDPSKQGLMSKENMSFRRIYNPRKVEKLINHLMKGKGWSEAKSVQWFLENAKNKKIGFHMKRWMDQGSALQDAYSFEDEVGLLGKDAFAKSDNLAIASRGVVPNFSNPLSNAIKREKAAGVPSSKIRVSQSNQLKGPANPMGLAVTNTRDEPAGISQGIRMARERGIDPKKHGVSTGLVPNFSERPELTQAKEGLTAGVIEHLKSIFQEIQTQFPEAIAALKKDGDAGEAAAEAIIKVRDDLKKAKKPAEYMKRIEDAIKVSTSEISNLEKKDKPTDVDKETLKAQRAQLSILKSIEEGAKASVGAKHLEQLLSDKKTDGTDKSPEMRANDRRDAHNEASSKNIENIDILNSQIAVLEKQAEGQTSGKGKPGVGTAIKTAATGTVGGDLGETQKAHAEAVKKRNELMANENDVLAASTEQKQGDLQKLFFMSSALAMVNGQLEEMATSSSGVIAGFAEITRSGTAVVQAHIAQKEMGGQFMESMGVKQEEGLGIGTLLDPEKRKGAMEAIAKTEMKIEGASGPKKGGLGGLMKGVGKVGRIFGRFLPVVGQLYTGFTVINEGLKLLTGKSIFEHLAGGVKRAEMAIKELGKQAEASAAAIEAITKKEKIAVKIADLEFLGDKRSVKQDQDLFKQRLEMIKADGAAAAARAKLTDKQTVGAEGVEYFRAVIDEATASGVDFKTALQEAQMNLQGFLAMNQMGITAGKQMDKADTQKQADLIMGMFGSQSGSALNSMIANMGVDQADSSRIANEVSGRLQKILEGNPDRFDGLSPSSIEDLINFESIDGMAKKEADMLKQTTLNAFHLAEEENDPDISENKSYNEFIKSMQEALEKGTMISQDLLDILHSNGEYKKILQRMVKQADAQSKLDKKIFDQKNSLSKISADQVLAEKKTLNEYGLISNQAMIQASVKNKLSNLALNQEKGANDADVKMKDSLRNMAGKDLRVENLVQKEGMAAGDVKAAAEDFAKKLKSSADAGFDGNDWAEKLIADGKGLNRREFENLNITDEDKALATKKLKKLSDVSADPEELQQALNDVFVELRDSGNKNASLLLQMAMINSSALPTAEEGLAKMRDMVIAHSSALDDLKVKNKLEQEKIKNSTIEELISKKTLVGATELLKRFNERGTLQERLKKDEIALIETLGGELATYKVINSENQNRLALLRKHTKLLAAAVAHENIEKTDKEIWGNERTLAGKAFDISMHDAELGSPVEMRRRKQLNDLLSQKISIETQDLQLSLENAKDKAALDEISGARKKQSKLSLDQEILEAGTQFKKNNDKLKLLNSQTKLTELAEIQLADEIVALRTSNDLADERERLLDTTSARSEIAEQALKEERRGNKQAFKDDLSKFQVAFHGREGSKPTLRKDEKLALKHETLTQRIEAVKLSVNQEILESMKRQRDIRKKTEELNIVSNKITETENAAREASLDQRIMNATVDADMQIRRFGQISSTRRAATTAGHAGATPEDILSFTEQFKELNKTTGKGSGAIDQLRIKMAEMSLSASNLGSDLMGIGLEGARSGMVQLFKDIGSGAESANEAWKKFSLGLAESILDRMLQHNVDKIIGDLTYAFTGVDPEKDANKFLIENNKELQANTEEMKKLRTERIVGLAPDKPPALGEKPDPVDGVEDKLRKKDEEHAERKGLDEVSGEVKKWINITAEFNAGIKNSTPHLNALGIAAGNASDELGKFFDKIYQGAGVAPAAGLIDEGLDFTYKGTRVSRKSLEKQQSAALEKVDKARTKHLALKSKREKDTEFTHTRELINIGEREVFKTTQDKIDTPAEEAFFRPRRDEPQRGSGNWNWQESKRVEDREALGMDMTQTSYLNSDGTPRDDGRPGGIDRITVTKSSIAAGKIPEQQKEVERLQVVLDKAREEIEASKAEFYQLLKDLGPATDSTGESLWSDGDVERVSDEKKRLDERSKWLEKDEGGHGAKLKKAEEELADLQYISTGLRGDMITAAKDLKEAEEKLTAITGKLVDKRLAEIDANTPQLTGVNVDNPHYNPDSFFSPPIVDSSKVDPQFLGGRIQKFAEGGFVNGPAGKDKVPAMLTAGEFVLPKEVAKNFRNGGEVEGYFKELNKENTSHRGAAFTQGVLRTYAMHESHRLLDDAINKKHDKMPTFDNKKFNQLNLKSDVSLRRGDRRMSSKALANDPVMEEYRAYLMDKAAYNVQKKNEKFKDRQQLAGSIISLVTSGITAEATSIAKPYLKKATDWAKAKVTNTVKGHMGFGEHSDAFKSARKKDIDFDYKDISYDENTGEYQISTMGPDGKGQIWGGETDPGFGIDPEHQTWDRKKGREADYRDRVRNAHKRARERAEDKTLLKNSGGSIPAMLTAGEGFIPAPIAKRIGYGNLEAMNRSGSLPTVQGKGGVDNVGPVGLSEGDFIIRKSSTDKLMKENPNMLRFALQNPEGFKRGDTGYYEGGIVGTDGATSISQPGLAPSSSGQPVNRIQPLMEAAQAQQQEKTQHSQNNEVTNNINVNVTIDSSGNERVETESSQGSYEQEQELAMKIKSSVLEVIREEKRIGGELDR